MKKKNEDSDVLTATEAAKLLRIGRVTLYDLCERGRIPHRRVGRSERGKYLFSRVALEEWIRNPAA